MRILGYIFRVLAGLLLVAYLSILLLLNFSPANKWLTKQIETALEEKLQTELNINRVEVSLFDRVVLHDVLLYDQKGKEMLSADLLSVKVNLSSIINKKMVFRTISVLDSNIRLYKENKTAKPNFQFVIDAFKPKDRKEPAKLDLKINSLVVRRTNISYDQLDKPQTPGLINFAHINARDLDASISLKHLTRDSLNMRVRSLSLKEQSGFDLRNLQMGVALNRTKVKLENLDLILPKSSFKMNEFIAYYKGNTIAERIKNIRWSGKLRNVILATEDIACFYAPLKGVKQTLYLDADCRINPKEIYFTNIKFSNHNKSVSLQSDLKIDLFQRKLVNVYCGLNQLQVNKQGIGFIKDMITKFKPKAKFLNLPLWNTVENVSAKGKLGYKKNAGNFAQLALVTNLGSVDTDLQWKGVNFQGKASADKLDLAGLLSNKKLPANLTASVDGVFDISAKNNPFINAKVDIKQVDLNKYVLRDLTAQGSIKNYLCNVDFSSDDVAINVDGTIQGYLKDKNISDIVTSLKIHSFDPNKLYLTKFSKSTIFSGDVDLALSTLDVNKAVGKINVSKFNMKGVKDVSISSFSAESQPTRRGRYFNLNSEFADVEFDGPISKSSFERLKENVSYYFIPEKDKKVSLDANEEWVFRAKVKDTELLKSLYNIPIDFANEALLEGKVGGLKDEAFLSFYTDSLAYGKLTLDNPRLYLRGEEGDYKALAQCGKKIKNTNVKFELNAQTSKDKIVTEVLWDDASQHKYYGSLGLISKKTSEDVYVTEFQPTELMINDSLWVVAPGCVSFKGKDVVISNVGIARQGQSLSINGDLSQDPSDVLVADLERIDVEYILNIFNVKPVKISGNASGELRVFNAFDSLRVEAKGLDVPNFAFNDAPIGHGTVDGSFSIKDKRINLNGNIVEEGVGFTNVEGYISPKEKSLDLRIKNKNTNVAFLDRYVSTIFGDISGRATGVNAKILITGVPYHLDNGKVNMTSGCFEFSNFKVSDGLGGQGVLNGTLKHKHLKELTYDINVSARDLQFYDRPQEIDMPFYATAGGTGTMHLKGKPGELVVDAKVRPHSKTQFYYLVDSPGTIEEVEFLTFRDAEKVQKNVDTDFEETYDADADIFARDRSMDIILNFTLDMNPEAKVILVMDEQSGDIIQLGGTGTVTAQYYNKGDFQMNGNVEVQSGYYKMSLQDIIRKDFIIEPGGSINFTGNPLESTLLSLSIVCCW